MDQLTSFFRQFADAHTTEKVLIRCLSILSKRLTSPESFIAACNARGLELEEMEEYTGKKIDLKYDVDTPICLLPVSLLNSFNVTNQFFAWCSFSAYLLDDDKYISFHNYRKLFNQDVTDYLVDFLNWVEWDSYHLFALADKRISESLAEFKPVVKARIFSHQKENEDEDVDAEEIPSYANQYHSEDDIDPFDE